MKEELIARKTITYGDEFLAEMELVYFLTVNDSNAAAAKKYGVRVIKETIENGAHISEDNSLSRLFYDYEEVLEFVRMLAKYEVTPIALEFIVDDYFSDYELTKSVKTA